MIIALDGPAGSGKTSTAKAVARALSYTYMDTGAMYRAITLAVLRTGEPVSEALVTRIVGTIDIDIRYVEDEMHVYIGDEDVTSALRSDEVNGMVSQVAAIGSVRTRMVDAQRALAHRIIARGGGVVVDGRDIGTVVFPDAQVKIFMDASPEVRARRRYDELREEGLDADYHKVLENVIARDEIDSSRDIAPLKKADDAEGIDTGRLTFEEQVSLVVNKVLERQVRSDV